MGHGLLLLRQIHEYNSSIVRGERAVTEERPNEITLLSDAYAWKSVDTILQSRYFQRLWVVQEILLSKSCYLWLGWLSLPFQSLCSSIMNFAGILDFVTRPDVARTVRNLFQKCQRLQHWASTSYTCLSAIADMVPSSHFTALPLVYYLYKGCFFQVSDSRDRFYSLRGLASDRERLPDPNYRLSYKDTWRRHTEYFVHSSYLVLLITKAGLWERESLRTGRSEYDLPSWLPLWFPHITPSASTVTRPYSDEDDRIWASFSRSMLNYDQGAFCRAVAGGSASLFCRPRLSSDGTRLTLPVHLIDSVATTALLDTTSPATLSRVVSGLKDHVDCAMYRRCKFVKTQGDGAFCCPKSTTADSGHDKSCKKLCIDTIFFENCVADVIDPLKFDIVDEAMRSNIEQDMERRELRQCNHIMVTTSGRLGFVHACTKPGDVLVLVPGVGDVMVLREVDQESVLETPLQDTNEDKTKKVFQVVGDAYLNGVMQGELMRERKADLVDVVLV